MINNMKIFTNGQEINLPSEIVNMFNQMLPSQLREAPQAPKPVQKPVQPQFVRQAVECQDIALRNIVIDMNMRLMKLEELIRNKEQVKSSLKQKVKDSKVSLKKTKDPKVSLKKGSKKVITKSKK